MTNTFDITAAEERIDAYLAQFALSGPIESQRAWQLIAALLKDLGATSKQSDWVCKLIVKSEAAQKSSGWADGWTRANLAASIEEVTA